MKLILPLLLALVISCSEHTLSIEESNHYITSSIKTRQAENLKKFGDEWEKRTLTNGDYTMKFDYSSHGEEPVDGRALYISMHGGGGTTPEMNDGQWDNQKKLYTPKEGVYFVPRSPTNTWNMWHQSYMDGFIEKIIELAVLKENVNPNKVYIMGYSAGGDGTYQLAPRLADLWAAAAMSAGHPGDAQIENLRNLPFALYMGGLDSPYNRNGLAREFSDKLDSLAKEESKSYIHDVQIYEENGHWMKHKDTISMTWMPQFERNPIPTKVVWVQDDVIRDQFYWLEATKDGKTQNSKIVASYNTEEREIHIEECTSPSVIIGLNDRMIDLDKPIQVFFQGKEIYNDLIPRTLASIDSDIKSMRDKDLVFPAKLLIKKSGNNYNCQVYSLSE